MAPILLEGCTSIPLKDEIFIGNKGMLGAKEWHTMTKATRDISFEEWMQIIRTKPLTCTSPQTFADMKGALEKACSQCNCCKVDMTEKVDEFVIQSMSIKP